MKEEDLRKQFEKETGKHAVWGGKETKGYAEWKKKKTLHSPGMILEKIGVFIDTLREYPITVENEWGALEGDAEPGVRDELNDIFAEIDKQIAVKVWRDQEVYGIDYKGGDALITNADDLESFEMFGIPRKTKEKPRSKSSKLSDEQIELIAKEVFKSN